MEIELDTLSKNQQPNLISASNVSCKVDSMDRNRFVKNNHNSSIIEYVESLCNLDPIPESKVDKLIQFFPKIQPNFVLQPQKYFQLLNSKSQELIDATGLLLIGSGSAFVDKILPLLFTFLDILPTLKPTEDMKQQSIEFATTLIRNLALISTSLPDTKSEIISRLFMLFKSCESEKADTILAGALEAMSQENFPFDSNEILTFVKHLEVAIADDQFIVLSLKVMKQIATLPDCPSEVIEQFYQQAQRFSKDSGNYVFALKLAIAGAIHNPNLTSSVLETLEEFIAKFFEPKESTYSPSALNEFNVAFDGIYEIVSKVPSKASSTVDVIVDNLLNKTSSFWLSQYSILRDKAVNILCLILKAQMASNNGDVSLVNSVFTTLYTPFYLAHKKYVKQFGQVQGSRINVDTLGRKSNASPAINEKIKKSDDVHLSQSVDKSDKLKQNELLLTNIILIIGNITSTLNNPTITELILSRLLSRIHYPPQTLDVLIIEQLCKLCILGQETAYNNIIGEFLNIFKRMLKDTETRNISNTAMPNALYSLATDIPDEYKSIRSNLAKRAKKLFCQLGKDITTPDLRSFSSPLMQGMGYLLPILAELGTTLDLSEGYDPESSNAKLSRATWFYCVLFHFVDRQAWRSDWFECTKKIAIKLSTLTTKKLYSFQQLQMEIESILQNGFTNQDIAQNYRLLNEFLPAQAYNIKNLTAAQAVYILSVYYLETMRASRGTFRAVFAYLEDPGVTSNEHLIECCRAVAEKAFPSFMEYLKNLPSRDEREKVLADETQSLMVKYCSRSLVARKVADKSIVSMAEAFPQITWHKGCLSTLLDLVETIGKACDQLLVGVVVVPNSNYKVELPDDLKDRQMLLKELVDLSTTYIRYGINTAPEQTQTMLQEYMTTFRELSLGFLHHIGFSLAVEISTLNVNKQQVQVKQPKGSVPVPIPPCTTSRASKFVNTLELKALYSGEIRGIVEFLHQFDDDEEARRRGIKRVSDMLVTRFKKNLELEKAGKLTDMKDFNNTMYRSVAFLSLRKEEYPELLHLICWSPVIIFTTESLKTAVSAWTWLLASRADLNEEVLLEISEAWSWTHEKRIGLFSDAERDPSPLSTGKPKPHSEKEAKKYTDVPHRIWINFLSERFIVIRDSSPTELKIMYNMLQVALSNPEGLSILPNSVSSRFRLLLLCINFLHAGSVNDLVSEMLLRERIYLAAIAWFCHEPTWYDPGDRDLLVEDTRVLIEFCKAMVLEDSYEKKRHEKYRATFYDSYTEEEVSNNQEIFLTKDLQKARKLIILLVGSEIDHIVAWTNPQNRISLQIQEEQKFSTTKIANWKDFITTAWEISPRLCIHMASRFPNSKTLRKVLERKVMQQPSAVLDVPEAVTYLVTEQNVRDNIPQLKYLLYWANTTPPVALTMLGKAFNSHPMVTQYAVRVLHSFPPETIIFYIPQLVQALRYDKTSAVFEYLAAAAKESELIAHQLIWNTQTYTETSEKNALTDICRKLRDRIISDYTEDALVRYKEEFEFFENVTKISGILLEKADTRDARKPLLVAELQKLVVKPGSLYLPTNPEVKVHEIQPVGSIPLQSAAKVPILVQFRCHTEEDEYIEEEVVEVNPDLNNNNEVAKDKAIIKVVKWKRSFQQGCIFKVGDDVRQDMLAVQIIELFKRIFKHVGVDIFLHPYKVIATKPGCGLIELVPNAMSRNDLGKKVEGGLVEWFQQRYGPPNSEAYQKARSNFVKSMAAYSVVSYILQVKDRHNGNIMFDDDGHIIHIDFGFMFESSPGGNMGFETSPFKLSEEMIALMGGRPDAEPFKWFMELGVKAFLSSRQYTDSIITLVQLMLDTELPCFREATIDNLMKRLAPDKSDKAAAKFFTQKMVDAFSGFSSFSTYFYDMFQGWTQGIDY